MPYSSRPPSIRAYTGGSGHGVSGRGTYDSYPELIGYSSQVHPSHDIHGADNVYRDYREHSYYKSHEGYTSQDNHRSHQLFEGLREDASYNRQRKPTTHQSHRPSSDYQESSYFTHDDDEELYFSDDSFTDTRGSNYQRRASSAPRPRYSQEGHCSVPHVSHGRNHRDIGDALSPPKRDPSAEKSKDRSRSSNSHEEDDNLKAQLACLEEDLDDLEDEYELRCHNREWVREYERRKKSMICRCGAIRQELEERSHRRPQEISRRSSNPYTARSGRSGLEASRESRQQESSRTSGRPFVSSRQHSYRHAPEPEDPKRRRPQPSAEEWQEYRSYTHAEPSRPRQSERAYTDSSPGKTRSSSSYRDPKDSRRSQRNAESSPRSERRHQEKATYSRGYSRQDKKSSGSSSRSQGHHEENPRSSRPHPHPETEEEYLPDHYAILDLTPSATTEQIKSAAKLKRIQVHPDKANTPGMSAKERAKIDEVAAKVGQAADILLDTEKKLNYDRQRRAASGRSSYGR